MLSLRRPRIFPSLLLPLLALSVMASAGPIASAETPWHSRSTAWAGTGHAPPVVNPSAGAETCRPGTGWRWTTGPAQPETAARVQQALSQSGIVSRVEATGFGETDSCGQFELSAVDLAITLADSAQLEPAAQPKLAATILPILKKLAHPSLGNVRLTSGAGRTLVISGSGEFSPAQSPAPTSPTATVHANKVLVVVFDPILRNGQSLSTYMQWYSYKTLDQGIADFFQAASGANLKYQVAYTTVVAHQWPSLVDGFRYTEPTYMAVLNGASPAHKPDILDYNKILNDPRFDICGKLNRGAIDEVWLWGGPWFGFWESTLAGPGAFWFNSPPVSGTNSCNKLVPIMGFNYERGLPEAVHGFGHRNEATMSQAYGGWRENSTASSWDRFALVRAQSPDFAYSGCGSVHYPPNGQSDYDYSNPAWVLSNCDDFSNYPLLGNVSLTARPVTCSSWNCAQVDYFLYWFGHLPVRAGCGSDMIGNDWWDYFADPDLALAPSSVCRIEDQDINIQYDGWRGVSNARANGGTYRFSHSANDQATLRFTGTSVTWVTYKGPDQGKAQVVIDGVTKGTFDLFDPRPHWNVQQTFGGLAGVPHTMVVKVLGAKNARASDTNVVVDAFVVGGRPIQDGTSNIQYNNWKGASWATASGGGYRSNGKVGSIIRLTFHGTRVNWITAKGPAYGKASVYIDGARVGSFDLYSRTSQWQVVIPFGGLGAGTHTIEVRPSGSKNASSTGLNVIVDAFSGPITPARGP